MRQRLLLLLPLLAATPLHAGSPPEPAAVRSGELEGLGDGIAAVARNAKVTFEELDRLLLDRYAGTEEGRAALAHLLQMTMLAQLEEEQGVVVSTEDVDRRLREIDEQLRATSPSGEGIAGQLKATGLTPEEFRRLLRLSIVHERLTRRALGKPEDAPVTGELQEMWLAQTLRERGCGELPGAWVPPSDRAPERVVLVDCAGVRVTLAGYLPHLRRALPPEKLRAACYQLLLQKLMVKRMPDLSTEAVDAAVAAEIERRRAEAESDPKHQGIPYEKLLEAQGIHPSSLERDPVIRVTALSKLWVERSYDEEALREVYANERAFFDGTYGEAVELGLIFLRAAHFPNDLIKRSFDEAEHELEELRREIRTFNEFQRLAARNSEAPGKDDNRGVIGYVTRLDDSLPEKLRAAAFEHLDRRAALDPPVAERLVGPLRLEGGCVLLWLGDRRPAPPWEGMIRHVRTELRRRFVEDDVLPEASVVTWMDLEK